ncbi:MAG: nitrogenase [Clostridia bacterium]|nr:nitrogenase [Clostridia bacterium]
MDNKEYQLIKDVDYEYDADIGLAYASPVRGVWNIVHMGTLMPQGHQIYVCPVSCLRGVVLTTAEMGAMDKMSTISIGEDNILEGDMEEQLFLGAERVINELPERPRMMMIFTSCIHHFMAVNYRRVYKLLQEKYPDIDFVDCYMDPIMRRTRPVVPVLWRQMHRSLKMREPEELRDDQVNYLGNCFPHEEFCDLTNVLAERGVRKIEINSCRTYDEFLEESRSKVNFVFHNTGVRAAKDLKVRLKQEWMQLRPGYTYDQYDEDLSAACRMCGVEPPAEEWSREQRRLTEAAVQETAELLGDTPVSIDYAAVDRPLELALFLLDHGFNVESVFVETFIESQEVFDALKAARPELKVYATAGWNLRRMERGHDGKVLCIGQKCAYFLDSDYFVNMVENDGLYGYSGTRRLMEMIREAYEEPKPMKELVQVKGLGCCCS